MDAGRSVSRIKCLVPSCRNSGNRNPKLSFHTFPKINTSLVGNSTESGLKEKIDRYKAWKIKLKPHKSPPRAASVCYLHFKRDDFLLPGSYDLERVKQIQWGRQNEANGIQSFEKLTGAIKVVRTGLWLHPCGFLGASPHGLIFSDGLIEVKCPYTLRNSTLAVNLKKSDILFSENGEYIVNKDHNYYDQIQGQLHITGRDYCYLVLWTTADVAIKKIEKDKSWEKKY